MTTQQQTRAFAAIDADATDLVLVHRAPDFAASLRDRPLVAGQYTDTVTIANARAVAASACAALDLDVPQLADDIAELAERFLVELHQPSASLRFEIVQEVTCPKFHIDSVHVRLITTYLGAGTEYCDAQHPDEIRQAPEGSMVLLKGRRHRTHSGTVLHRSPAAHERAPRVVLVLDY